MSNLAEIRQRNLKSQKVFDYFEELAAIPHGSGNTRAISDYLADFAKKKGLEHYQDALNNIVMIAEATPGYEAATPVILQGHMDMVCEKESGCDIDFEKDGLRLLVDGDFLTADGTTLGGDDGIAVAYALAILDSPEIAHPRLEIVITVDEETGMDGAEGIDLSMLKGHTLLNLDSDEEGHFLTSCAGGVRVTTCIPVDYITQRGLRAEVTVTGLNGGHSGSEIGKELANANILMGRLLKYIADRMELGIAALSGGNKDNAIPRESTAVLYIPAERKEVFAAALKELEEILKKEFSGSDAGVCIRSSFGPEEEGRILSYSAMSKVIFYLRTVPNGRLHMSQMIPGLVETSLNLGILTLTEDALVSASSIRSSVSTRKADVADRLTHLAELLGGETETRGDYPAWEYRADSPLRTKIGELYRTLFDEEPVFDAIHAGLECGLLSEKIPNLDCVSFGPDNFDIHTPRERLSISSTEKIWILLVEFLKSWKEET